MAEIITAQTIAQALAEKLDSLNAVVDTQEVSLVDEVGDGIARVSGLRSAMAGELLEFKSSETGETVFGLAQNLERDEVGAVLFGNVSVIKEGDECRTTGHIMDIPVGRAMLGRVVNPLGWRHRPHARVRARADRPARHRLDDPGRSRPA